jgi:hypothetical protein
VDDLDVLPQHDLAEQGEEEEEGGQADLMRIQCGAGAVLSVRVWCSCDKSKEGKKGGQ